uniref:Uncharacterized protein n=1 Tax=Taeniopygia guttata TaxID=59729 RepID=A0A674GLX8_TAEGU
LQIQKLLLTMKITLDLELSGNNCSATSSATLLEEVEVQLPLQKEVMNFLSQVLLAKQAHHMPENHTPKQVEERKHLACLVSELSENVPSLHNLQEISFHRYSLVTNTPFSGACRQLNRPSDKTAALFL